MKKVKFTLNYFTPRKDFDRFVSINYHTQNFLKPSFKEKFICSRVHDSEQHPKETKALNESKITLRLILDYQFGLQAFHVQCMLQNLAFADFL